MVRVLHVITTLGFGGAERMLCQIAAGCKSSEVEQVVVTLLDEGEYGPKLRDAGVELHCLRLRRGRPSPRALFRLVGILRRRRPDVVMTWLYHADLLGTVCAVLAGLRPKQVIWNIRCSNMDLAQYGRMTRWVARVLAWLSPLPGAVAINSEAGRQHHIALGYRPRTWIYLPNGFDPAVWRPDPADRAQVRRELGVAEEETLVGMVARSDPQKDHANFLAACEQLAAKHHGLRFLLIGEGTSDIDLPETLRGRLVALESRSDVPRIMRALDVHVLSSAFGEGFPNVVAEAMATEVPCVVTDVGDAAKLVKGSGITVSPSDPVSLADAIEALIKEKPEQRNQRGQAARSKIIADFHLDAVCNLYNALWRNSAALPR